MKPTLDTIPLLTGDKVVYLPEGFLKSTISLNIVISFYD